MISAGDVVGVHGGKITKRTSGADHVMVVSTQPGVLGNGGGAERADREHHEAIAFVGQTPVRVRGDVEVGDVLVASGADDGTAVALAPHAVRLSHLGAVIGIAWDDAAGDGIHRVNAAIGIDQTTALEHALRAADRRIARQADTIDMLVDQVAEMQMRLEQLEERR